MKRKRASFSKLLLLLESAIVLYTTYQGFGIAKLAIELGFMGTLPWIATMVTAAWGAYGTSAACYYAKAKEPLNNSLCPVSARCISRNLHLVKVISVQNGHYFSAFLLLFLKKGRLPLYQVAESFRPAMASAYKLAQANIAYSRFSFFFKPRYTVFL